MTLILGSTSPRRADLLRSVGLTFSVLDPGVDDAAERVIQCEAVSLGLGPGQVVRRLALAKLMSALRRAAPGHTLLTADTTVDLDGELLGKAADELEASAMLSRLRGRSHRIHTGVAVALPSGRLRTAVATSEVWFRTFSEDVLQTYLRAGVWRGKAGAYGVQDAEAAPLVDRVEGSLSNVKGLPLELTVELADLASEVER